MDRYPAVVYLGAAVLGKVGAEMMLTDPYLVRTMHPTEAFIFGAEVLTIIGILAGGRFLSERTRTAQSVGPRP